VLAGYGEPPVKHDEHVGLVDVALGEQPGAAAQGAGGERGQQGGDVVGVKAAEQLSRAQHVQLVFGARPARSLRTAENVARGRPSVWTVHVGDAPMVGSCHRTGALPGMADAMRGI